jgi:hypothetical protein
VGGGSRDSTSRTPTPVPPTSRRERGYEVTLLHSGRKR